MTVQLYDCSFCYILVEALKKAKECNPQGRCWIKADACDVRKGLRESMRGIWAGDEDMGDGSLGRVDTGDGIGRISNFFGELEAAVSVLDTKYSLCGGRFSTVERLVPLRGMVARSL